MCVTKLLDKGTVTLTWKPQIVIRHGDISSQEKEQKLNQEKWGVERGGGRKLKELEILTELVNVHAEQQENPH